METLFFVIIILAAIGLVILGVDLYLGKPNKTTDPSLQKREQKSTYSKTENKRGYSLRNEKNNFRKALQKARNNGKLRFNFHGEYYPTGLKTYDGK